MPQFQRICVNMEEPMPDATPSPEGSGYDCFELPANAYLNEFQGQIDSLSSLRSVTLPTRKFITQLMEILGRPMDSTTTRVRMLLASRPAQLGTEPQVLCLANDILDQAQTLLDSNEGTSHAERLYCRICSRSKVWLHDS